MKLRYRIIEWLAMRDMIIINVDFGFINHPKKYLVCNGRKPDALIQPRYENQSGLICNCYADFGPVNLIDTSERFPQPVWFDEAMRRGK